MSKYLILFLALSLSIAPVFGDEDPPQMNPKAEAFVTGVQNFVDQHASEMPGFDSAAYMAEVQSIAESIDPEASLDNFDVDSYIGQLDGKVDEMLGQMTGDATALKQDYLGEVANFFLKEYGNDMQAGVEDIDTDDYINDLTGLNDSYDDRIRSMTSPPPSGNSIGYDPMNYLDKAASGVQRSAKFEIPWVGINGSWIGYNMVSLIQAFQQRFSYSSVAQSDFQYLMDLWPQSAEAYLMNSAYDMDIYNQTGYYETDRGSYIDNTVTGEQASSFALDEFGNAGSEDGDEFDYTSNSTSVTASYNNRSYGYHYTNNNGRTGTRYDCVSITTNGHKYTLQENIYTSPIVLDMDNDGAISASNGKCLPHVYQKGARLAEFDMNGDGFADLCEWVGPNDGLLMTYDENKGYVDANDLFGNAGGFLHGYEKLSLLDTNQDHNLTGDELSTLSVWCDKNTNAKIDDGEVQSVQAMGITSINISFDYELIASFVQNDEEKMMRDWYPAMFTLKKNK